MLYTARYLQLDQAKRKTNVSKLFRNYG
jgi:hypothetical protein